MPRAASLRMVAGRAGVSIATASRVMNGLTVKVSEKTLRRVRQAAAELDYQPQSVGRALRVGKSRIVGVLVANLGNPVMAAIAASVEHALRRRGYVMLLCDTHERPEIQDEYLREMEAQLACAVVMVVAVRSPRLDAMRRRGIPLLFINRRDPDDSASPYIGIDNIAAGRDVARHCIAREWRAPSVIHASSRYSTMRERLAGFLAGMAEGGVDRRAIARFTAPGLDHLRIGQDSMARLLSRTERPSAVVCLSDMLAYGAFHVAHGAGLNMPDEVAIVSFDDGPLNAWIAPWLSAVHTPYEQYGAAVVEALDKSARGESVGDTLLRHELLVRDQARQPRPSGERG
jgi:LacI family transcriptional regulator